MSAHTVGMNGSAMSPPGRPPRRGRGHVTKTLLLRGLDRGQRSRAKDAVPTYAGHPKPIQIPLEWLVCAHLRTSPKHDKQEEANKPAQGSEALEKQPERSSSVRISGRACENHAPAILPCAIRVRTGAPQLEGLIAVLKEEPQASQKPLHRLRKVQLRASKIT